MVHRGEHRREEMRVRPQIFIAASHHDRPIAQRIARLLQEAGYDVHWESTDLGVVGDAAAETARQARCVLVIWSFLSVTSRWVGDPALEAFERKALVQIEIDPVRRPIDGPCISFANWPQDIASPEWRELKEALRAVCGRPNGDLPVREQAIPAIAATLLVMASAGAMALGLNPASPSLEAFNPPETLSASSDEQGWAQGGAFVRASEAQVTAAAAEAEISSAPATLLAFDAEPLNLTWRSAASPRLLSAKFSPVEGPSEEFQLAVNLSDRGDDGAIGPPR